MVEVVFGDAVPGDFGDVSRTPERVAFSMPSRRDLLYAAEALCDEFLERFGQGKWFGFRVVVRELLVNAVHHGNRDDASLRVRCELVHLDDSRALVMVGDEGAGFDYRALNMSLPEDPLSLERRGYILVNALADRIAFNDSGNEVRVWLSFGHSVPLAVNE